MKLKRKGPFIVFGREIIISFIKLKRVKKRVNYG